VAVAIHNDSPPDWSARTDPENAEKLVKKRTDVEAMMRSDFEDAHKAMTARWHRVWHTNRRFITGHDRAQWQAWGDIQKRTRVDDPPWREKITINITFATWRRLRAVLRARNSRVAFLTDSSNPGTLLGADAGRRFDVAYDEVHNASDLWAQCDDWGIQTGNAWIKVAFDPKAGPRDENGTPAGDLTARVVSPFEVFPYPYASRINTFTSSEPTCPYLFQRQRMHGPTARMVYSDYADKIPSKATAGLPWDTDESRTLSDRVAGEGLGDPTDIDEMPEIVEGYYAPNGDWPFGLYGILVNGRLVDAHPFTPFIEAGMNWPFIHDCPIPMAGSAIGLDVLSQIIEIQKQMNREVSQRTEIMRVCAYPRTFVNTNKPARYEGLVTTEPGQHIPIPLGDRVTAVAAQSPPAAAFEAETRWLAMANLVGSTTGSSMEVGMPGADTATEANIVAGSADAIVGDMVLERTRAMRDFKLARVRLARVYFQAPRIIRIVGEENAAGAFEFCGEDLKGVCDLRVTSEVGLPRNPMQRATVIQMLVQVGLMDVKTGRALLNLPEMLDASPDLLQRKKARNVAVQILKFGIMTPRDPHFDDDEVFIEVFKQFGVSSDFTSEKTDPRNKMMFRYAYLEHMFALAQNMAIQRQGMLLEASRGAVVGMDMKDSVSSQTRQASLTDKSGGSTLASDGPAAKNEPGKAPDGRLLQRSPGQPPGLPVA